MSETPPTTAEQADAQAKVERALKRLLAFARSPGEGGTVWHGSAMGRWGLHFQSSGDVPQFFGSPLPSQKSDESWIQNLHRIQTVRFRNSTSYSETTRRVSYSEATVLYSPTAVSYSGANPAGSTVQQVRFNYGSGLV